MQRENLDKLNRKFEYLRISVTDKCNFRCKYCMPKENFGRDYQFLRRDELLTFEEIIRSVKIFQSAGLKKIRLTGGEPLLRKNVEKLVEGISSCSHIHKIAMTTNGSLFDKEVAHKLKESGLNEITISLDSLSEITRKSLNSSNINHSKVMNAIDLAIQHFGFVKINMVVVRGINDSDIINMIDNFKDSRIQLRFIEYMDVGETNNWNKKRVMTSDEIIHTIKQKYSLIQMTQEENATAEKWKFTDNTGELAFISSISKPFCSTCVRGRLSADGKFYTCLFSTEGYDFREILRNGQSDEKILIFFKSFWGERDDRYSELRYFDRNNKNKRNKIEMSYIGG